MKRIHHPDWRQSRVTGTVLGYKHPFALAYQVGATFGRLHRTCP
ncbi:hypothetical protein [Chloracidobacterium validum]|nr:hypothetical protein [Chloracidobacterium validum]